MPTDDSYLKGIDQGFKLVGQLISATSHYDMTARYLVILEQLPGVEKVDSYEVFTRVGSNSDREGIASERGGELTINTPDHDDLLFRQFPLSLEGNERDQSTETMTELLHQAMAQEKIVFQSHYQGKDYIVLEIDEVIPIRLVFIEGKLDDMFAAQLEGLHSVYASQTKLLDAKERDQLTHLLNRHSLDHTLEHVNNFHRNNPDNARDGKHSWLVVLDIDHFKQINDRFGHLFGDEVLIHFANIMQETMRYTDFLFRFGGEEFVIILNSVNEEKANQVLERLREKIATFTFPSGKVTVSMGYTLIDGEKTSGVLIEEADKAVYAAKENGRDQVRRYDPSYLIDSKIEIGDVELF